MNRLLTSLFGMIGLLRQVVLNQERIMAQLDDLKALVAEVAANQTSMAASLADLADDVDKLLALVSAQPPPTDLTYVIASVTAVRDTSKSLADAAAADAAKFPPPAPVA
jgi:methyl-accepting chemotaxis protein